MSSRQWKTRPDVPGLYWNVNTAWYVVQPPPPTHRLTPSPSLLGNNNEQHHLSPIFRFFNFNCVPPTLTLTLTRTHPFQVRIDHDEPGHERKKLRREESRAALAGDDVARLQARLTETETAVHEQIERR
jgi:hypothetical protein